MTEEFLDLQLFELDDQEEDCELYCRKWIIAIKHAEREGKIGATRRTEVRHIGRAATIATCSHSLVAELAGIRVLQADAVCASTLPYELGADKLAGKVCSDGKTRGEGNPTVCTASGALEGTSSKLLLDGWR